MINELLCSLRESFSISNLATVISIIAAIVSIIATFVAWSNKRKAEQYAKNADEANQSVKKLYEFMYKQAKIQDDAHKDRQAIKERILAYMRQKMEQAPHAPWEARPRAIFSEQDLISEVFENNPPPELWAILKEFEAEECIRKIGEDGFDAYHILRV